MRTIAWFVGGALLLIGLWTVLTIQVRTDFAFICENTGSRYGYQRWFFGGKTGRWYKTSPLEGFMEKSHPDQLQHRWTSYAGTGKSLLGRNLSFGHGRPGPVFFMDNKVLGVYLAKVPDEEKLRLFQTFASGDRAAAQFAVDTIFAIASGLPPPTNTVTNPTNFE